MRYTVLYMEQLDLNKLRIFIKVIEAGSLTKAAQQLKQPKSRVSRHLADLETSLNTQLVFRTTRKLQLTEEGRQFFEAAQLHIKELEELKDRFSSTRQKVEGLIRITAPVDLGVWCLPEIIDEFVRMYPKAEVEVILSQQFVDLVAESVDLALRIANLKDSTLKATRIANIDSIIVASPHFVELHPNLKSVEQIQKLPTLDFLLPKKGSWLLTHGEGGDSKQIKVNSKLAANDPDLIRNLVLKGHGISLLPEFLVREDISQGKLIHIFKNWKGGSAPLHVVTPGQKEAPLRVKTFRDFLIRKLRNKL